MSRETSRHGRSQLKTLIVAGGGTGGHVLAGVAVADAWRARFGEQARVLFVGARGGIEERLVPRAGYPLELLDVGKLNHVSLGRKLKTVFQLPLSFLRSALILIKAKPGAVLGVGGYSSGPLVLMARILGFVGLCHARTAILEQNSIPGLTNRILGKLVHEVFSAFPGTEAHFGGSRTRVTGNPIRAAIEQLGSASPGAMVPQKPFTVFIFGGSQGAMGMNTLVLEALPILKPRIQETHEIQIIHQTGERDYERVRESYAKAGVSARVEKFIYEMPETYGASSLIICRAGSSTLSEVAAVGRASILVPFPEASDNHQEHNARVFSEAGAAVLLIQRESKGKDLADAVFDLLDHPEKRRTMEARVREFHRPRAAERIAADLLETGAK